MSRVRRQYSKGLGSQEEEAVVDNEISNGVFPNTDSPSTTAEEEEDVAANNNTATSNRSMTMGWSSWFGTTSWHSVQDESPTTHSEQSTSEQASSKHNDSSSSSPRSTIWNFWPFGSSSSRSTESTTTSSTTSSTKTKSMKPPTLKDVPKLLELLERNETSGPTTTKVTAARRVYELCDVAHKQNRIPMVHNHRNVLHHVSACLFLEDNANMRRLAVGTLNNLAIPVENKSIMAHSTQVVSGLCHVISQNYPESYQCCICLMNLSFLESNQNVLLHHSPPLNNPKDDSQQQQQHVIAPLENPKSLVRVLETLLLQDVTKNNSERVRWACGLMKNLSKTKESGTLFASTFICTCLVQHTCVSSSGLLWRTNSLADFSLYCILHLAQWPETKQALIKANCVHVIAPLVKQQHDNVQGIKAAMACAMLQEEASSCWNIVECSIPSLQQVLINVYHKRGKKDTYHAGTFKLPLVCKAYQDLCIVAATTSSSDNKNSRSSNLKNTKRVATPCVVAILLDIICLVVCDNDNDEEDDDDDEEEDVTAEHEAAQYAVGALEAMLAVLLEETSFSKTCAQSANQVSQLLLVYSESVVGISNQTKQRAQHMAHEISSKAASNRLVFLEQCHTQCRNTISNVV